MEWITHDLNVRGPGLFERIAAQKGYLIPISSRRSQRQTSNSESGILSYNGHACWASTTKYENPPGPPFEGGDFFFHFFDLPLYQRGIEGDLR